MEDSDKQQGVFEGQVLAKLDELGRFMAETKMSIERKADRDIFEKHVKETSDRLDRFEDRQRSLEGKLKWLLGGLAVVAFLVPILSAAIMAIFFR